MKNKFLASALIATAAFVVPAVVASADQGLEKIHLQSSNNSDVYWNKWSDRSFSLNNEIIPTGFGLAPYYSDGEYAYSTFFIKDYTYTTLEAFIGVDDLRRVGDRGTSTINIYADDKLIYTYNFTNKTDAQKIKVSIPEHTNQITFTVSNDKGTQGRHSMIIGQPTLTNSLPQAPAYDGTSLLTIGTSSYHRDTYRKNYWNSTTAFKLGDSLVNRGFGLVPYSSSYEYANAQFNISDYNYTTLETILGLDSYYVTGDRGTTTLAIYADGLPIYSKIMTNKTEPEAVKIAIPTGTTWLKFVTAHDQGTQGFQRVVLDNPVLTNSYEATPKMNAQLLTDLQFVDSNSSGNYKNYWSESSVFTDATGTPISQSIGLYPYSSYYTDAYASYFVGDYNQPIFDTTFSLDSKWLQGDYGTTKVTVLADDKSIGSVTLNSKNPTANFSKAIPKGTKYLKIQANFARGTAGPHGLVAIHPTLREGFTDIQVSHAYFNEVNYLTDKNIINGYADGTFKPSNTLTRGHAAMLVARALNLTAASSMKFSDVAKDYNGYKEIAAAVNAGLFDGIIKGNKFEQSKPLTRGEMADILAKAFNLHATSSKTFNDTNSYWAKNSITALYDNQITTGYENNTFRPDQTLTRGHFTLFIARAMNEAFR